MKTYLYNFDQICITIINSQDSQGSRPFPLEVECMAILPNTTPTNGNHPTPVPKIPSWGRNHSSPQIGKINPNLKNMDLLISMPQKAESPTYLLPNTISVKNSNKSINNHGKDRYMNNKSPFSITMVQMPSATAPTTRIHPHLNPFILHPESSTSDSKNHKKYSLTNIFRIPSEERKSPQASMKTHKKNTTLVG